MPFWVLQNKPRRPGKAAAIKKWWKGRTPAEQRDFMKAFMKEANKVIDQSVKRRFGL